MKRPLVEMRGVTKAYPGVLALDHVDLDVRAGEVHAVVGLNGAGKSTLVRLLAGLVQPDSGQIRWTNPPSSRGQAFSLVPQEILMVPELSIGRNVLLGIERRSLVRRRLDAREVALVLQALLRVGLEKHPETMPRDCTTAELRLVQITKALVDPGQVLLLDEPTAVLPESDAELLLKRVAALRDEGEAVVYVSHRIGEVVRLADRISVLRDGKKVAELQARDVDRQGLIDLLTKQIALGQAWETETAKPMGKILLEIQGLTADGFRDVNLTARAGEVVALVGLQDAGQSLVVQTLAGTRVADSGEVRIAGVPVVHANPTTATSHGLVLVPADRRTAGVVSSMDIQDNIALSPRSDAHRLGLRHRGQERKTAADYMRRFNIKAPSASTEVAVLSGGNQQKVALARALEAQPIVLLLDEPTQGIDVATKGDVLARIKHEARTRGQPVLAATSELEEVPGWADTALVFHRGEVVARLDGSEVTEERLLQLAVS